jgi:hypothetical protein
MISNSQKVSGLDISACGSGKLVEELIDDIYSIMEISDYLLLELPEYIYKDIDDVNGELLNDFVKRFSINLNQLGKSLILSYPQNCENINIISDKFPFIVNKYYNTINILQDNSFFLDMILSTIKINEIGKLD